MKRHRICFSIFLLYLPWSSFASFPLGGWSGCDWFDSQTELIPKYHTHKKEERLITFSPYKMEEEEEEEWEAWLCFFTWPLLPVCLKRVAGVCHRAATSSREDVNMLEEMNIKCVCTFAAPWWLPFLLPSTPLHTTSISVSYVQSCRQAFTGEQTKTKSNQSSLFFSAFIISIPDFFFFVFYLLFFGLKW